MVAIPFLTKYLTPGASYATILTILLVFGGLNGVIQFQGYGIAGPLPFKYMGMIFFGNAMSGLCMNLIKAIL